MVYFLVGHILPGGAKPAMKRGEVPLQDELKVLRQLAPELMRDIARRAQMLTCIESMQPVGRRALAARLGLPEREVRAAASALREQGLIAMDAAGMQLTPAAFDLLPGARDLSRAMFGLADLEQALSRLLKIGHVVVVSGDADGDPQVLRDVGRAAANRVLRLLQKGMTLAVTGGGTMSQVAQGMHAPQPMDVMVVPARGGMGSAVAELLSEKCPTHTGFVGMHGFGTSAPGDVLLKHYGLDDEGIYQAAKKLLKV